MKRNLLCILIVVISNFSALGTPQSGDLFIWKGNKYPCYSYPLEQWSKIDSIRDSLFGDLNAAKSTGCHRDYIAEWSILDDALFLTNIYSSEYLNDGIKADLVALFGSKCDAKGVKADWVTGNVLIPTGKVIHQGYDGSLSFYDRELVLILEEGKLLEAVECENIYSHKSEFTENSEKLWDFIYSNVDWNKIPNLGTEKFTVSIELSSSEVAKPDIIGARNKVKLDILNKEALRVANMIPDWNVYYKACEVYRQFYILPIAFSEEIRRKYTRRKRRNAH